MASLRKLRRRLLRWERYVRHYRLLTTAASDPWPHLPEGYWRATHAIVREEERRYWAEHQEALAALTDCCTCPGCMTGGRCIEDGPDDNRCCLAGDEAHPGPCVIRCTGCNGNGRCPECGGLDDLGCWHCDGTGGCPHHCDDGEIVLEAT